MTAELSALSLPEKLSLVEELWDSIVEAQSDVESPAWHAELLAERLERVDRGAEVPMDWDAAKESLRQRLGR